MATPFVRALAVEQQRRLALFLAGNAAGALAFTVYQCRRRYRVEGQCGQRFVVLTTGERFRRIFEVAGGALFALVFLPQVVGTPDSQISRLFAVVMGFSTGGNLSQTVLSIWWRRTASGIELCEHGIIIGAIVFRGWSDVYVYKWSKRRGILVLNSHKTFMTFRAAERDRDRVDAIIAEHGNRRPHIRPV
ncbi:MAG: hypothetical protein R3C10_18225 [Pirellulales bacterium]